MGEVKILPEHIVVGHEQKIIEYRCEIDRGAVISGYQVREGYVPTSAEGGCDTEQRWLV